MVMLLDAGIASGAEWELKPTVMLPVLLTAVLYASGTLRFVRRRGTWRGLRLPAAVFVTGWVALVVALVSPLHEAGERRLSAHMAQHLLLVAVAAPLVVLGHRGIVLGAIPGRWRRGVQRSLHEGRIGSLWRFLTSLPAATVVHAVTLWLWRLPVLYELAVRKDGAHAAQHLSFFGTALLFWWSMLYRSDVHRREGVAVLCLFATALESGALGALLTFSERLWYGVYAGDGALADQQLAGVLMWVPGGVVWAAAALFLAARWLRNGSSRPLSGARAGAARPEAGALASHS